MSTLLSSSDLSRVNALNRYQILDTPTESDFDDIARLAAALFDAPIGVVNLISDERQWFKAEVGIGVRELPLEDSICRHAILQPQIMVVPDTTEDLRFASNPLVTMVGGLRFYAGAPLETPDGYLIGTVCVLDREARPEGITDRQRLALEVMAKQVMAQLELRRVGLLEREARRESEQGRARYQAVFESAVDYAIVVMDRNGLITEWNEGARRILGWTADEMRGKDVSRLFTSEDRLAGIPELEMKSALLSGTGIDERWHLRRSGERFWASGEMMPLKSSSGDLIGYVRILRDMTEQRLAADRKQLLMEELAHRVKNTFSVVQAIAAQSLRHADRQIAATFQARLLALGQAHDLLLQKEWASTGMQDLVTNVLRLNAEGAGFVTLGPDIPVGPRAAFSLSLLLHELATNSMKYGALSVDGGKVEVRWHVMDNLFQLRWTEVGGPAAKQPERRGFGSRLIGMGISGSKDVSLKYLTEGLVAEFGAPLSTIAD